MGIGINSSFTGELRLPTSSSAPKRKSQRDPNPARLPKKAKATHKHELKVSDESFRTTQTPHFGVVQPIGTQAGSISFNHKAKWRMKEWHCSERSFRRDLGILEEKYELESPKETTRYW
jgi:hypothetical protein